MNSKDCLNSKQLIEFVDGNLNENDKQQITQHLANCDKCARNLNTLTKLDELLNMKDKNLKDDFYPLNKSGNCISDELIYRYLEGMATENETKMIERHVNSCQNCFSYIASIVKDSLSPATAREKLEVTKLRLIKPEQQINKIMSIVEKKCHPTTEHKSKKFIFILNWLEKIKLLFKQNFLVNKKLRYAVGFACVLIFTILVGFPQYKIWQSNSLTMKGVTLLIREYTITSGEEPRPVGGFDYSLFGITRGRDELKAFEPVKIMLEEATHLNNTNLKAHQYLGTYFLVVEKDWEKANDHYQIVYSQDSTNSSILNDLGIISLYRGNYEAAIKKFVTALNYNPELKEAQYNLVIAYLRQGNSIKAEQEWKKYTELDTTSDWTFILKKHIEQLKNK